MTEGPDAVRELIAWGAHFDTDPTGSIALTREGGHHRNRIAHAGGDATGAEVSRALVAAVRADPGIDVVENALVLDIITSASGRTAGGDTPCDRTRSTRRCGRSVGALGGVGDRRFRPGIWSDDQPIRGDG